MFLHVRFVPSLPICAALTATALALPAQGTKPAEPVQSSYEQDKAAPPAPAPDAVQPLPGQTFGTATERAPRTAVKPDRSQALQSVARLSAEDREDVHFDEPGDGALWAAGASFKARFDAAGAAYVPFLGSAAPRNYPLGLQLLGVTVGGQDVTFQAQVPATRSGTVVAFERGALTEQYIVSARSVEQRFVFPGLPVAGDLAVRIGVDTELGFVQGPAGFEFLGEHGGVLYGAASALDAAGARLSLESRWESGAIEIRVPAEFVSAATFPLTIDPVITTFAIDNSPFTDFHADVAYDETNSRYVVVWERVASATDHDIYAKLFNTDGTAVTGSGAYIDFTGDDWREPRVANNNIADQFLVVAVEGAAGSRVISGRTRDASSNTMGNQFQISAALSGEKLHPDVGGDPSTFGPTYYCVTWERVFVSGVDHDVHARLVLSDSTLLGSGTIFIDNSGGTLDTAPSISSSNGLPPFGWQNWNIVWQRFDSGNGVWNIHGGQLSWDGTNLRGTYPIETSTFFNDMFPKVSPPVDAGVGPRQYLVVYERDDGAPNFSKDIYVSAMEQDTLIDRDNLSGLEGTSADIDQFVPSVDTDGLVYGVAYQERFGPTGGDFDVYAATIYICGHDLYLLEGHRNLAFDSSAEGLPSIASRYSGGEIHTEMIVAWQDSVNSGDIEGGIYSTPGPLGSIYCSPAVPNSSGLSGQIAALGTTSVSANHLCLLAHRLPNTQFGYFLVGAGQGVFMPPASNGFICVVGGPLGRYNSMVIQGPMGSILMNNVLPFTPVAFVQPGQTWNFQCWNRDVGNTNNFTDAVTVIFTP